GRVSFFQAEDGIRDRNVTGVQTCALPIFQPVAADERAEERRHADGLRRDPGRRAHRACTRGAGRGGTGQPRITPAQRTVRWPARSEERRGGKGGRRREAARAETEGRKRRW